MLSLLLRGLIVFVSLFPLSAAWAQIDPPLTVTCTGELPSPTIPPDARWLTEIIQPQYQPAQKMWDLGFTHVVGALNIVTTHPCERGLAAIVEIQSVKLYARDPVTGKQTAVRTITPFTTTTLVGETFYRQPNWFLSGKPGTQPAVLSIQGNAFVMDVHAIPLGIYHAWTHPRLKAQPGYSYFIEVVIRITGDARVQFGIDHWKGANSVYNGWSEGCLASNNCEAMQSDWAGDTNGKFVVIKTPKMVYIN